MHLVSFERRSAHEPTRVDAGEARSGSMGDAALGFESLEPVRHGARRIGAVLQFGPHAGDVVDLNRSLAIKLASDDVGAPEAEADSLLPWDMLPFLRRLPSAFDAASAALAFVVDALERYDSPDLVRAGVVEPRRSVRLCAPVPRPGKLIGTAGNHPDAAALRPSGAKPGEPVLFLKAPTAVIGPEDEIALPGAHMRVDCVGELAVVIGVPARGVAPDRALDYVAGYCAALDVTARGEETHAWDFFGKSCDTFAPLGPALITADEIPDPQDLAIRTDLSGELLRSGRTKEMVFSVAELIAFASRRVTLEPGDLLLTGAPNGEAGAEKPPRWLRDGDVVDVEIERIGHLRSYVREVKQASR